MGPARHPLAIELQRSSMRQHLIVCIKSFLCVDLWAASQAMRAELFLQSKISASWRCYRLMGREKKIDDTLLRWSRRARTAGNSSNNALHASLASCTACSSWIIHNQSYQIFATQTCAIPREPWGRKDTTIYDNVMIEIAAIQFGECMILNGTCYMSGEP